MCSAASAGSHSESPWTLARQAPLSMGFSRQEYWSGLPSPSPGDLPDLGSNSSLLRILQAGSLPLLPPWKTQHSQTNTYINITTILKAQFASELFYVKKLLLLFHSIDNDADKVKSPLRDPMCSAVDNLDTVAVVCSFLQVLILQ